MLRTAFVYGAQDAFAKLGLAQPPLPKSINVPKMPAATGLPKTPSIASLEKPTDTVPSLGQQAAKVAANVGLHSATPCNSGVGAVRGEPADEGRRVKSIIDRAFQRNEDDFATSSMSLPGARTVL